MRQKLLYFALGLLSCVGISATTVSVMTVKPQHPKTVVVKIGRGADETKSIILNGVRDGYILKSCSGTETTHTRSEWVIVMERY